MTGILAGVIVFSTTYSLVLPAITLDESTAADEPGIVLEQVSEDAEESAAGYVEESASEEAAEETSESEAVDAAAEDPEDLAVPADNVKSFAVVTETVPETIPSDETSAPVESSEDSAVTEESFVEEESAAPEESSVEEESAVPEESSVEEEPAAPEESSVEEESAAPEESFAEEESAAPEESIVEEESAAPEESSAEEESAAPEESSAEEESAAPEESSAEEESAAPEESSAEEESAAPEESSAEDEPIAETFDIEALFAGLTLTGDWTEDLLAAAQTAAGTLSANTGTAANDTADDSWNHTFVKSCLIHAGIPASVLLQETEAAADMIPIPGDLVFVSLTEDVYNVGIVTGTDPEAGTVTVLEGTPAGGVQAIDYSLADSRILGIVCMPENPDHNPAQDFTALAGDVQIIVKAPEGAFPAAVTMIAETVVDEAVLTAAADAVEGTVRSVQAVDITFRDRHGVEIEPKQPVRVSMASAVVETAEEVQIVHVDDEGVAEVLESDTDGSSVAFAADGFSVYVIVDIGELPEDNITQTFENDRFIITASYNEKAAIPENAVFRVSEITRESDPERYQKRLDALYALSKNRLGEGRIYICKELLDLGFWIAAEDGSSADVEIEPEDQVLIAIQFRDTAKYSEGDRFNVIHFLADGTEVVAESVLNQENTLEFNVGSFSDFAVVGEGSAATIVYTPPVSDTSKVHQEGDLDTFLSNLPYGTVFIDYDLMSMGSYTWDGNTGVSNSDSNVTCTVEMVDGFKLGGAERFGVMYDNLTLESGQMVEYDGTVATIRYTNVATISDGSKADVVVTISNTTIKNTYIRAREADCAIFYGSGLLPAGSSANPDGIQRIWGEMDFNIKVVANETTGDLTGKTFLFGIDDYDIEDRSTIATTNALNTSANFILDIDDEGNLIGRKLMRNSNDYVPGYGAVVFTEGNPRGTPTGGSEERLGRYFSIPVTDEDEKVPLYDVNRSTGQRTRVYFTSDPDSEGFVPQVTTTVTDWPAYGLYKSAVYGKDDGEFKFYLLTLEPTISESVTLVSGMVSEIYVPETSCLYIDGYNLYPTRNDNDTLNSGYFLIADANEGLSFTARCQGRANSHLRNSNMYYTIYSRTYEGGSISTVDTDVWGNQTAYGTHQPEVGDPTVHKDALLVVPKNKTAVYTMTPDTFFHIWKVKISDGTEGNTSGEIDLREVEWDENGNYIHVGENGTSYTFHKDANGVVSYIFEYVDRDHWITVWWEKEPPRQTITVIKKWDDENNARLSRPDNIIVHVVRSDGGQVNPEDEDTVKYELVTGVDANIHGTTEWIKNDSESRWEYTFEVCELPEGVTFKAYEESILDYERLDLEDESTPIAFDYQEPAVEVGYNEENHAAQYQVELLNRRKEGDFSFTKMDQFGRPVVGAAFRLFSDVDCTKPDPAVHTAVSDGSGVVTFTQVPYGMHYMKETNVPSYADGRQYDNNTRTVYQVYFHEDPDIITITPGHVSNHEFIADGDPVDPVINTLPTGEVIIKKIIVGEEADKAETFDYRIEFGADMAGKTIKVGQDDVTLDENGYYEFSLSDGDEIRFSSLPDALSYRVEEYEHPRFRASVAITPEPDEHAFIIGEEGSEAFVRGTVDAEQTYTITYTNTKLIDDTNYIIVEKQFAGITKDQIPDDFEITVTGNGQTYTLTKGYTSEDIFFHESEDGLTWKWTIYNAEAGTYTVSENGEEVDDYIVTTSPAKGSEVTVIAEGFEVENAVRIDRCNNLTFDVDENFIFIASLTAQGDKSVVIVTNYTLSAGQREAIKAWAIEHGGTGNFKPEHPYIFYSVEKQGKVVHVGNAQVTYDPDASTCSFQGANNWQHTIKGDLSKIPAENPDIKITNTYTKKTQEITVVKTDEDGDELPGAVFALTYGMEHVEGSPTSAEVSSTSFELEYGIYCLRETQSPDGYVILNSNVFFKVGDDGVTLMKEVTGQDDSRTYEPAGEDEYPLVSLSNDKLTIYVENTPGSLLPHTGGAGTMLYTLGGFALIGISALMYGFRMRRRERRFI